MIITGNGSACVITFQAAYLRKGQRMFTNSGSASMGYDLPAAIGASISSKNKKVICIAGDGSLMMNIQELETVKNYNLPIKIIILNNQGYASIKQTQNNFFPDNVFGVGPNDEVSFPSFEKVGKAFLIKSKTITTLNEWQSKAVQDLLNSNDPVLFDVKIDPNQIFSPKLASKKLPDGTMSSPSLEDMAPFLSREEFLQNIIDDK